MADDFRKFDDHGFPIPPRYEDLKFHDEDSASRPKVNMRVKRWLLLALLVGIIVPIVFGPRILASGRNLVARWLAGQAEQKYYDGNLEGALADLDDAIEWDPTLRNLYWRRAICREAVNDLEGCLADWNKLVELLESSRIRPREKFERLVEKVQAYSRRSWIYVRLGQKESALADATRGVELLPNAVTWNTRAYSRAVLGVELEAGLADIEKAMQQGGESPNYLDTRGYLLHLLGRNEEALTDMNRAILPTEREKTIYSTRNMRRMSKRELKNQLQEIDHSLAVMYHHRGLIYKQLGRTQEAEKDLSESEALGYDPDNGVF
jgi:tetratricopeptide (TPR) repeat protein